MSDPVAKPHAALATTNRISPVRNIVRRPRTSPSRPAGTSTSPKASAYPDTTHCRSPDEACSPSRIDGSATLTMLTSSRDMKPATRQTAKARQRRGSGVQSGSPPWPCCRSLVVVTA